MNLLTTMTFSYVTRFQFMIPPNTFLTPKCLWFEDDEGQFFRLQCFWTVEYLVIGKFKDMLNMFFFLLDFFYFD